MRIAVQIPASLRNYCRGESELTLPGSSVRAVLRQLELDYPAIYTSVCDERGTLRPHVNLFVNDSFLHDREGFDTILKSGDVLTIMPAVSGG